MNKIFLAILMCGFVESFAESISSLRGDSHESPKQSTNHTKKTMDGCFATLTNPLDCHDLPKANLAMTENNTNCAESRNDGILDCRNSTNLNEFIISYRAIMKNNVLIGEEFKVAKALTTSQNPTIIAQCDIIEFSPSDSHIKTLKQNQSVILECIERELKSKIRDDIKSINNEVRTKTTYKIPAQRILLDRQRSKIHIIGQK